MIQREKFRHKFCVPFCVSLAYLGFTPLEKRVSLGSKMEEKTLTGFTLLEVIITVGIFLIAIVITMELFITSIRVSGKTNIQRKVIQEARNAIETITREARLSYGSEGEPAIKVEGGKLTLTPDSATTKTFELTEGKIKMAYNGIPSDLTSSAVKVTGLTFSQYENYNPSLGLPSRQPSVTIEIGIEGAKNPEASLVLKTTISSRDYEYQK